jgi:Flp pilus assembly pilin Flp
MQRIKHFVRDEEAQDLIEYTLILAFVALTSAGLFMNAGGSIANIWGNANAALTGVCDDHGDKFFPGTNVCNN